MADEQVPAAPIRPDRLVAFLHALEKGGVKVQKYVDRATEVNLAEVPTLDPSDEDEDHLEEAKRLHNWAYGLTGSSARARAAIGQISDGVTPGFLTTGPDQIGEVVAEVADRIARETADRERAERR